MKDNMKTDRYLVNYYIFKRLYIFSENLFNSCQQGKRQSINIIPIFIEVTYSSIFNLEMEDWSTYKMENTWRTWSPVQFLQIHLYTTKFKDENIDNW